ncbi:MAG: hypothetical protein WBF08_05195 [Candidatus Bathyarchaeia archaeon]
MARFTLEIPDELDKKLRIRIIEKYGSEKGSLTKALIEAIELWLKQSDKVTRR